jgi:hypothetical protein
VRLRRVGPLLMGSVLLSACGFLVPAFGTSDEAFPSPLATYTRGKATITITAGNARVITLERVSPGPHLYTEYGAEVRWLNDDGWALGLIAPTARDPFGGSPAVISMDRITDRSHLTTMTMSLDNRCIVDVTKVDASGVSGKATCKGLRWTDALAGGAFLRTPEPLASEPPFDAEIVFEASP